MRWFATVVVCTLGVRSAAVEAANPFHGSPAIQGTGAASPLLGQAIATRGIVTALEAKGFFLQDATGDGNLASSDGIFVFTNTTPTVQVGQDVQLNGTVDEFNGATQLKSPNSIQVLASGTPLPAPRELTSAFPTATGGLGQLESIENMRVHVTSAKSVGPTNEFGEIPLTIPPHGRTFREKGILAPGVTGLPVFDGNPERLFIDSDGLVGAAPVDLVPGVAISDVVGVMDYNFNAYKINPTSWNHGSGTLSATPVRERTSREFTVASFNILRMFDTVDDPAIGEPVVSAAEYSRRLDKLSLAVTNVLRAPDVIGFQEVENLRVLEDLAARVQSLHPELSYTAHLVEGNDVGGIDVGFLTRDNVRILSVVQEGKTATYVNPANNQPEMLNDRPPLVLKAEVCVTGSKPFPVTVVVNHLRSLNGVEGADGRVRAKRKAQAEYLANLVQDIQDTSPEEKIALVGDFNAFQMTDGYVDVAGILKGDPDQDMVGSTDLVDPDLIDLVETIPAEDQYSFVFNGDAQVLDHIFVSQSLQSQVDDFEYARNNADFPIHPYEADGTRPERVSDHDMPVAFIGTIAAPASDTTACR